MSLKDFKIHVPRAPLEVVKRLQGAGYQAYLVGGAVRDSILQRDEPNDWDVATSATPPDVIRLFEKSYPRGLKHGTVAVVQAGEEVEVTTFRRDGLYIDGRHPEEVTFVTSLKEDLSRRDFTFNAMAYDPVTEELFDPFDGMGDLKRGILRTVGEPRERFEEDRLRMLRAIRFAGDLKCKIEGKTFDAIREGASQIGSVSMERIRDEFFKILLVDTPSFGLEYMRETGLMEEIVPELLEGYEIQQNKYHAYSVYVHLLKVCDGVPPKLHLRLAGLFHDIGKPRTKKGSHFYGHEVVGAGMTEAILKRLRAPNDIIRKVVHLVCHHMVNYSDKWGDAAVRRFVRRVGAEHLEDLFYLIEADVAGKGMGTAGTPWPVAFEARVHDIIEGEPALSIGALAIDGSDIMELLEIPPGPEVGSILEVILNDVLEDPSLNRPEILRRMVIDKFARDKGRTGEERDIRQSSGESHKH
jgi:tRNA nucleotidyltransferase (CCA-adding enzyme)